MNDEKITPQISSPMPNYAELTLEQAWILYKEHGDTRARAFIAHAYAPMVANIARKVMRKKPPVFDYSDLVQCGTIGLLDAIEKFSPAKKILFSTYAPTRIKGEIIDSINRLDWTPRSIRDRIKLVMRAIEKLEKENGSYPKEEEIAAEVSLPLEVVKECLRNIEKTFVQPLGLDYAHEIDGNDTTSGIQIVAGADFSSEHYAGVEATVVLNDDNHQLKIAMKTVLNEQEQKVTQLHYFENMNHMEIMHHLSIPRREVKKILDDCLVKLKGYYSSHTEQKLT